MLAQPDNNLTRKPSFRCFHSRRAWLYARGETRLNNDSTLYSVGRQLQVGGYVLGGPQFMFCRNRWTLQLSDQFMQRADQINRSRLNLTWHIVSPSLLEQHFFPPLALPIRQPYVADGSCCMSGGEEASAQNGRYRTRWVGQGVGWPLLVARDRRGS
jgi:hypothetical protein